MTEEICLWRSNELLLSCFLPCSRPFKRGIKGSNWRQGLTPWPTRLNDSLVIGASLRASLSRRKFAKRKSRECTPPILFSAASSICVDVPLRPDFKRYGDFSIDFACYPHPSTPGHPACAFARSRRENPHAHSTNCHLTNELTKHLPSSPTHTSSKDVRISEMHPQGLRQDLHGPR